eukprot:CAMPEP_0117747590 /NCGR_PEP_ID=MMETSP0947-20121206/8596_1 /TAXON_ID=44440 /ORGANISM="Chattonella subsalsa, Strain CCMP2191" /LENGTH=359 /DNA_ID=CAMNT_0005565061 /DNA_START=96 /DNA_END=1172 /DNA_ORIENTATION=-
MKRPFEQTKAKKNITRTYLRTHELRERLPNEILPKLKFDEGLYNRGNLLCKRLEGFASFTMVIQATVDRIWMLSQICIRWKGPISLVIFDRGQKYAEDGSLIERELYCPERIIVQWYNPSLDEQNPRAYPINKLRNLGISQVNTTHYFLVDIDFWSSDNLYDMLILHSTLHPSFFEDPLQTIVIPAFEKENFPGGPPDSERRSWVGQIPSSFTKLLASIKSGAIKLFDHRFNKWGHSSTDYLLWFMQSEDDLRQLECLDSERYEPYIVMRKCPGTPKYDERFTGYGKNKIQYIIHLRYAGYKFAVLPKAFIVHFPHHYSRIRDIWQNKTELYRPYNDGLYEQFIDELELSYPHVPKIKE